MDGWMDGWMDGRMDRRVGGYKDMEGYGRIGKDMEGCGRTEGQP